MTSHQWRAPELAVESELDKLTYSAYLLTLDPDLALTVVTAALDDSVADESGENDLLMRTVELALKELQGRPTDTWDRASTPTEVVLYRDYKPANSGRSLSLKEENAQNPILSLELTARIAFVLHHVVGYEIAKSVEMSHMDEKQFRSHLHHAYAQLISLAACQNLTRTVEPGRA